MRHLREILRQKLELGHKHRQIAQALRISAGSVGETVSRTNLLGLDWAAVCKLDDTELEAQLYGAKGRSCAERPVADMAYLHAELHRPGVTLQRLHLEYLEKHPDGYRYTTFCEQYREWCRRRAATMRQHHVAGDKVFVDYSCKKPHLVDRITGEFVELELYVAVLGASNYTYAEATMTQQIVDWTASNARALEYFGGVPNAIVPDQLKSAVTTACRYEPGIQRTFDEFAEHYGTTIFPARPIKPRDKAKVEVAVQVVQRWILARLRNQVFYSLGDLNRRIRELLEELNGMKMRVYRCSRRELFERVEHAALRPLPEKPFECADWKKVTLNVDYHASFEDLCWLLLSSTACSLNFSSFARLDRLPDLDQKHARRVVHASRSCRIYALGGQDEALAARSDPPFATGGWITAGFDENSRATHCRECSAAATAHRGVPEGQTSGVCHFAAPCLHMICSIMPPEGKAETTDPRMPRIAAGVYEDDLRLL